MRRCELETVGALREVLQYLEPSMKLSALIINPQETKNAGDVKGIEIGTDSENKRILVFKIF